MPMKWVPPQRVYKDDNIRVYRTYRNDDITDPYDFQFEVEDAVDCDNPPIDDNVDFDIRDLFNHCTGVCKFKTKTRREATRISKEFDLYYETDCDKTHKLVIAAAARAGALTKEGVVV